MDFKRMAKGRFSAEMVLPEKFIVLSRKRACL